jgi:hypothetical protein
MLNFDKIQCPGLDSFVRIVGADIREIKELSQNALYRVKKKVAENQRPKL